MILVELAEPLQRSRKPRASGDDPEKKLTIGYQRA